MKVKKELLTLNVLVLVVRWLWLMHFISYNLPATLFSLSLLLLILFIIIINILLLLLLVLLLLF